MRTAEIQVGTEYLIDYSTHGRVLETAVPRSGYRGSKTRRDGVRVLVLSGFRQGKEVVYGSQAVKRLWSDYQAEQDARQLAADLREEVEARFEQVAAEVQNGLRAKGVALESARVYAPYNYQIGDEIQVSLNLTGEELLKLQSLLGEAAALPARAPAPAAPASALEELLS